MAKDEFAQATRKIIVTVVKKQGICTAGYRVGEKIVFRLPRIDLRETDRLCINALSCLMPYLRQWSTEPVPPNARPYVGCSDPGPEDGGRGHVTFHLRSADLDEGSE